MWQWAETTCWIGRANDCRPGGKWPSGARNLTAAHDGGCPHPYCEPHYDDRLWRRVDVPHDYVVEGSYAADEDWDHGFRPHTPAWYRRRVAVPAAATGGAVWVVFDGVFRNSLVWLNGVFLGHHRSGCVPAPARAHVDTALVACACP